MAAFASDAFASFTSGTELNGRTLDTAGGTWTATTGVFQGFTNNAACSNKATSLRGTAVPSTGAPAGTSYSTTGTITASSGKNSLGLLVRYSATNNFVAVFWNTANWVIRENNAGTETNIATGVSTNNPSTAQTVTFTCSGVSPNLILTATAGATQLVTVTYSADTHFDAKGLPGIYYINTDTINNSRITGWSASDTSGGAIIMPWPFMRGLRVH